ncbi:MAG: DNA glycosylase [Clostridia bacterium]|nr:DNA glycosylase [Clostridia bacterium]
MKYEEFDDYILVTDCSDFDIKQTLECGQVFRYKVRDFGYTIYSLDQKADIYCQNDTIKIFTNNTKYFVKYFDFCTNYDRIKSSLEAYPELKESIRFGSGIRILRSDPLEMIIEFIISQNNNIPRIKSIIEKICECYGENKGDYYAFPTLKQLESIPREFFTSIKCGYRDSYLYESIQMIARGDVDIYGIINMTTHESRIELMKLKGVGRKVADCILLFGYGKTDVFPTDTWVVKAYNHIYNKQETNAIKISQYLVDRFGGLSGYAQQYLFYNMRENKIGEKL